MKDFLLHIFVIYNSLNLFAQEIDDKNYYNHPDIVSIRKVYNKVESNLRLRVYDTLLVNNEYSEPYEDTRRKYYIDKNGVVRKFIRFGGSGDSAAERAYYYDSQGKLVFVFINAGAANGTSIEQRIYFKNDNRIFEKKTKKSGPGWGFPDIWHENDIIYDAQSLLKEDKN